MNFSLNSVQEKVHKHFPSWKNNQIISIFWETYTYKPPKKVLTPSWLMLMSLGKRVITRLFFQLGKVFYTLSCSQLNLFERKKYRQFCIYLAVLWSRLHLQKPETESQNSKRNLVVPLDFDFHHSFAEKTPNNCNCNKICETPCKYWIWNRFEINLELISIHLELISNPFEWNASPF